MSILLAINTTETWAEHFSSRGWSTPQDQINAGYPLFAQPTATTGSYRETFDFGTVLASSKVTVGYTGAVLAGAPTITPKIELSDDNATWSAHAGVLDVFGTNFRYVRVTLTETGTPTALYRLDSLTCRCDAKLKSAAGTVQCLAGDPNGTLVNFATPFLDVTSITVTPGGTTPITPVYDFQDAVLSGTYSISGNVLTVNVASHGLIVGQAVCLNFTSGTAVPATVIVASTPTANQFTATLTNANTSGNVSTYPQGFRIYLFNLSGTRVSGPASYAIKGY